MKALQFAIGLIFDDWWLFGGIVVTTALSLVFAAAGWGSVSGAVLVLGVLGSIIASTLRAGRA